MVHRVMPGGCRVSCCIKLNKTMTFALHQPAPAFQTITADGAQLDLSSLRGKKVYIAFERNVGCPVCHLHTHQLLQAAEQFAAANIVVVLVYESTPEHLHRYLEGESFPFHFVADPDNTLYNRYGVRRSWMKVWRGLMHGLMQKVMAGKKLTARTLSQDGHLDRIPSEFLLDESGRFLIVHHGRFVGDHLPIATLLA